MKPCILAQKNLRVSHQLYNWSVFFLKIGEEDYTFTDMPVTRIRVSSSAPPPSLTYAVLGDGIAQEGSETFQLQIGVLNQPPPPPDHFLRDTVTITIADTDSQYQLGCYSNNLILCM